jgi:1,2-diacylglycerol 3-alpha-glucosyltransferase
MLRRKTTMVLVLGDPIVPTTSDPRPNRRIRMELARRRMHDLITRYDRCTLMATERAL